MSARQILVVSGLIVLALGGCKNSKVPAQANGVVGTPPVRAPGLWKLVTTMEGASVSTSTLCLDADTDKKLAWGSSGASPACQDSLSQAPDGSWKFSTTCKAGAAAIVRSGVATGDFQSAYSLEGQVTVTGLADPQLVGSKSFSLSATHEGACPAGMAPGMMDVPGQGRVDALNMGPPP